MSAATLTPVGHDAVFSTWNDAFGPVPANEEWSVDVRVVNNQNEALSARLRLVDTSTGTSFELLPSTGYSLPNQSSQQILSQFVIPAGWKFQDFTTAATGKVTFIFTGTKRSTL